ncbi:MAG: SH3 domain-containing protein [Pseudomonadota bacterium]
MTDYEVTTDWTAAYEHPIELEKGEELWLSGKSDNWGGHTWVWARNTVGKEGWIPDDLVIGVAERTYARTHFSAKELTCRQGETLYGIEETHGWVLCRNTNNSVGWVPSRNLRRMD